MSRAVSLSLLVLLLRQNEAFLLAPTTVCQENHFPSLTSQANPAVEISESNFLLQNVETMNTIMTTEFFETSPVLKRMHSQCVKSVEIRESSIPGAGLGLFATKNIKSGTIVSFYPAHSLGVDGGDQLRFSCLPLDEAYFKEHPSTASSYLHCTDQPLFKRTSLLTQLSEDLKDVPLYLDVNPERDIVGAWVSQMINDGATVESNTEKGVLDYYQTSGAKRNCIHIPWGPSPVMATVTTKKVKKGEELFTTYGGTYWLGVWLDIHGEEGVGITDAIQSKIQETATELLKSMQSVSVVYATQAESMETEVAKLVEAL